MSDPSYAHQYTPRSDGTCRHLIAGTPCDLPERSLPHIRWTEQMGTAFKMRYLSMDSLVVATDDGDAAMYVCGTCSAYVCDLRVHHEWHLKMGE